MTHGTDATTTTSSSDIEAAVTPVKSTTTDAPNAAASSATSPSVSSVTANLASTSLADSSSSTVSSSPASSITPSAATATGAPSVSSTSPTPSTGGELLNGGYVRGGAQNDPATGYYDEIEIEDMEYDESTSTFYYPCPCGDRFRITRDELLDGEDIARCPSCSLLIKVIYDPDDLEEEE